MPGDKGESGAAPAPWQRGADGRLALTLHIQPGARKTEIVGLHGNALKIRLAAPPVDGKANAVLCAFLAERLAVPKTAVTLKSGHHARRKQVIIDPAPQDAVARLEDACGDTG